MNDLYSTLNIDRDASAKDVRAAFRALAKDHHPDQGGDAEIFRLIQLAYAVLKDPVKRRKYDQDGLIPGNPIDDMAQQIIAAIFEQILKQEPALQIDVIARMTAHLNQGINEQIKRKRLAQKILDPLLLQEKRFSGPVISAQIPRHINALKVQIETISKDIAVSNRALEILKDARDNRPPDPPTASTQTFTSTPMVFSYTDIQ